MDTQKKSSRVWLITGSSTGFGRSLAEAALKQGDRVIATARQVTRIEELQRQYPESARAIRLDVTEPASIQAALQAGLEAFGRVDILVNNAGYGLIGAIEEVSDRQIREQFETNVFGVLNVTRAFLPVLRRQGSGHIVNFSSIGGRIIAPAMPLYHATKFALEGISEALSQEVKPFGIKVSIIEPGGFDTDFLTRSLAQAQPMPEYAFIHEQLDQLARDYEYGDVPTGVQAVLKLVDLPDPPLRLPIGPNAMPVVVEKLRADLEAYQQVEPLWRASALHAHKLPVHAGT